jgi:hypothetical protein
LVKRIFHLCSSNFQSILPSHNLSALTLTKGSDAGFQGFLERRFICKVLSITLRVSLSCTTTEMSPSLIRGSNFNPDI